MKVEQISIFLENKSGRLAEVTDILPRAGVNIRAPPLADTADFGILRLIVNQTDRAKQVLKESGFTVGKTEVVALEVPDRQGGGAGAKGGGSRRPVEHAAARRAGWRHFATKRHFDRRFPGARGKRYGSGGGGGNPKGEGGGHEGEKRISPCGAAAGAD